MTHGAAEIRTVSQEVSIFGIKVEKCIQKQYRQMLCLWDFFFLKKTKNSDTSYLAWPGSIRRSDTHSSLTNWGFSISKMTSSRSTFDFTFSAWRTCWQCKCGFVLTSAHHTGPLHRHFSQSLSSTWLPKSDSGSEWIDVVVTVTFLCLEFECSPCACIRSP